MSNTVKFFAVCAVIVVASLGLYTRYEWYGWLIGGGVCLLIHGGWKIICIAADSKRIHPDEIREDDSRQSVGL